MRRLFLGTLLAAGTASHVPAAECPPSEVPSVRLMLHEPDLILARLRVVAESPSEREPRIAAIRHLFEAAGCPSIEEQRSNASQLPNLVCTLAGATPETIVVGGSLEGDGDAAAALLPSLYETLAAAPRRHTFSIVAFTPQGLGGKRYLQALHPEARSRLVAMIHVGPPGMGDPFSHPMDADGGLLCDLDAAARAIRLRVLPIPVRPLDTVGLVPFRDRFGRSIGVVSPVPERSPLVGAAHWLPFRRAGIRILGFHSDRRELAQRRFDPNEYMSHYRLLAVFLALADESLAATPSPTSRR